MLITRDKKTLPRSPNIRPTTQPKKLANKTKVNNPPPQCQSEYMSRDEATEAIKQLKKGVRSVMRICYPCVRIVVASNF